MIATLLAMQQADAAFPSGSFAFSNGIEGVAALPYPFDRDALRRQAEIALRHRWAGLDRIALVRAWHAGDDLGGLAHIDEEVEAANVVASFREGSRRAGRALLTSHARLGTSGADALKAAIARGQLIGHLPTMQGALFRALGMPEREAVAVSGYQAIASLTSAAVRLGRVGALEAQTVIRDLLPEIAALTASEAIDPDAPLESFTPFLDIAAMRSADAAIRLFSS
jgi:urease accessory protein